MNFEKKSLCGKYVTLEPLASAHKEGLCEAIMDGELWNLFFTIVPHPRDIDSFINYAQELFENKDGLSFVIIENATGKIAGSTRFMKANIPSRRVEIGFTFLGKTWQKTAINTEAKYLMLTHGFEHLGVNRVEFITDYLNHASRNAILRLGAKEEGVLRSHMVMRDGRVRDSVLFSVVKHEWSGIKQHLLYKLAQRS